MKTSLLSFFLGFGISIASTLKYDRLSSQTGLGQSSVGECGEESY